MKVERKHDASSSILGPWWPLNWCNLVALSGFCWRECESGSGAAGAAPGTEGRTRKFRCTKGIHQILAQQKDLQFVPNENSRPDSSHSHGHDHSHDLGLKESQSV